MYGKVSRLLLVFIVWIAPLQAQQPSLSAQDAEDLLYQNEDAIIPERPGGIYTESGASYIDLNNASEDDLEASGLFTSYQLHILLMYREKYGLIYSIYELAALPGFHSGSPQELESFTSLNSIKNSERNKAGKHMLLVKLERSFPTAEEFLSDSLSGRESLYAGSPLKSSIRVRSHPLKNLSLALCSEKDAGELLLYRKSPQYLSGYLSYNGTGLIKHLVLGNFQLNQGVGLVNGAGFFNRADNFKVNQLSVARIKPYASLTESMYEQGIASRLGSKQFQLVMWASFHKFSLSSSRFTSSPLPEEWLAYQWTTGLFRTKAELDGRNLAYRIHSGIQFLYRKQGLTVGIMSGSQWLGASKKGTELLKKSPKPSHRQMYSVHANWYKRKIQVFGEMASDDFCSLAFLLGSRYSFNDFIQGSLLLHHYGINYRGSLPSSYGSGNRISNEQGAAFHLHMETGRHILARLTGELFRYPSPPYGSNVPSRSYRLDLSFQNPRNSVIQWRTRLVRKSWQSSPAALTSGIRPLIDSRINRIDAQLTYEYPDRFKWLSRLVISYLKGKASSPPAYAIVQQLTLSSSTYLKISAQFVLFHVSDWKNRIYLYEPGFYYSFYFPAYYGLGQKTTFLLSIKPMKKTTVSVKISGMKKDRLREWKTGIQLRLNL